MTNKKTIKGISLLAINYAFQNTLPWVGGNWMLTEDDLKEIRDGIDLESAENTGRHVWSWFHKHWKDFATSQSYFDIGTEFIRQLDRYDA